MFSLLSTGSASAFDIAEEMGFTILSDIVIPKGSIPFFVGGLLCEDLEPLLQERQVRHLAGPLASEADIERCRLFIEEAADKARTSKP